MSQIQQLYRGQSHTRNSQYDVLAASLHQYEAALISELFRRNGREDVVQTATPPGYGYRREDIVSACPVDAGGPVMQIAAHPGDGPDFFYATCLKMATSRQYSNDYHEILLTNGERGVDGWTLEQTRQTRIAEAYAGAEIVGSTLHFMGYPDGGLSVLADRQSKRLVIELTELIRDIQPGILIVHPPINDHPDHAYSFLFTLAALELNAQAGGRTPTLLMHDVEFGLQWENLWASDAIGTYAYTYPMHVPAFIVDISSTHQAAQRALHMHKTQMHDPIRDQPKAYADLIDTLAQIRGLQFMDEETTRIPRGQGFSHVIIPGVTSGQNALLSLLSVESVYTVSKFCP